ncbi:MAG TPA: MFS transporter [Polyangiaceae bacterium]|nr:MFS transporter [Polyangiaceae bacterium]
MGSQIWRSRGSCRLLRFAVCARKLPGPLLLGRLFDRWGRRTEGCSTPGRRHCAASSAYLTVSELFPVEVRGIAIALFYALGTAAGAVAPSLFGQIVDDGSPGRPFAGYAFASLSMLGAAAVARRLCVASEGRSLEAITSHDSI